MAIPYVALTLRRHETETIAERLRAEARITADALPWGTGPALDEACRRVGADLGARLTVIGRDGRVLCESTRPPEELENHAGRPEIRSAFDSGAGESTRWSSTVGQRMLYVAWRQANGADVRVIRTAVPLTAVGESMGTLTRSLLAAVALATLLGLLAALLLSRRMLRRIERLVSFARALAASEPAPYIAPERLDDLGLLEAQLAEMASAVAGTITALRVEQERSEAILRGMVEGVLVTDLRGGVVLMNQRARELLDIPPGADDRGRPLMELTRDPALAEVPRELAAGADTVSRDVTLAGGGGHTLQVNGARLRGADGLPFGFVLVLHDVTELRRLEVIRRDFVANVSHELRTPLTAIKGYAETLLGTAGDDRETARRFLGVIDRHSERLGRLIDDLLTLSDLELGRTSLRLGPVPVGPTIDDVLQILAPKIAAARIEATADIAPSTPPVLADGDRLRQVLINLVDNAIKYTPAGGKVDVRAALLEHPGAPRMVEIVVEDSGVGIPAHDLPRLTERFFRVDKARSRELGGTGLGLAIVKHIMQALGGQLVIASVLGKGTSVRALFPVAQAT